MLRERAGHEYRGLEGTATAPVAREPRGDGPEIVAVAVGRGLPGDALVHHPEHVHEAVAVEVELRPGHIRGTGDQSVMDQAGGVVGGGRARETPAVVPVVELVLGKMHRCHHAPEHCEPVPRGPAVVVVERAGGGGVRGVEHRQIEVSGCIREWGVAVGDEDDGDDPDGGRRAHSQPVRARWKVEQPVPECSGDLMRRRSPETRRHRRAARRGQRG